MIITATGHRPDKLGGYTLEIRERLRTTAREYLAFEDVSRCVVGMAQGWDQAFAYACFDLGIPFTAAIPFVGQERVWPKESRWQYHQLIDRAQHVEIVSPGGYSPDKMQVRNEWMVDNADKIAALWDGTKGGTANCLQYARTLRKPINNLWRDFAP